MDDDFSRYAVYFLPDWESRLFQLASQLIGWDCQEGRRHSPPGPKVLANPDGIDIESATRAVRNYGFHATIKPPMRLARNMSAAKLAARAAEITAGHWPFQVNLRIKRQGRFVALVQEEPPLELADLAADCVKGLDGFRARPRHDEIEKRRAAGLTPRQEDMLARWGYPYVLDEFRFHMTLAGPMDERDAASFIALARTWIGEDITLPIWLDRLALVGEGAEGKFRFIRWLDLREER